MLWGLLALVLILWLVGFAADVAGGLIHILLVVALVVLIFNLVSGRRSGM
ncbi:MAG: lmo0937 family membrane protein [Dehalococcoidia bacterium]